MLQPGDGEPATSGDDGPTPRPGRVAVVVVGRNEGERLRRCLASMPGAAVGVVYADSGSADGSPQTAREMGADVLVLDPSVVLSAARGRNAGFRRLEDRGGGPPEFVQFVDGDCELRSGWIDRAARELAHRPDLAIVCGVLRERDHDRSVYRRLCDMEWRRPIGPMTACGGIFMVRAAAFRQVGGFDERMVVGEEGDLCRRLIGAGWGLERLDVDMATHDSGMTSFAQWWSRAVRGGYASALAGTLSGGAAARALARERRSGLTWAVALPVAAFGLAWPTHAWSLVLLLAYPILMLRIAWRRRAPGENVADRLLYGAACVIAKWPQLLGQFRFLLERRSGRGHQVIEYRRDGALAAHAEPDGR